MHWPCFITTLRYRSRFRLPLHYTAALPWSTSRVPVDASAMQKRAGCMHRRGSPRTLGTQTIVTQEFQLGACVTRRPCQAATIPDSPSTHGAPDARYPSVARPRVSHARVQGPRTPQYHPAWRSPAPHRGDSLPCERLTSGRPAAHRPGTGLQPGRTYPRSRHWPRTSRVKNSSLGFPCIGYAAEHRQGTGAEHRPAEFVICCPDMLCERGRGLPVFTVLCPGVM